MQEFGKRVVTFVRKRIEQPFLPYKIRVVALG
jgi:hypothetical protein